MAFFTAVAQGLLFVVFISLAVTVTVRWGLIGILIATTASIAVGAVAFSRRSPHDEQSDRTGHDWYEV
jgi:hypothetical protein